MPAGHRLFFREQGLAIELHAVRLMCGATNQEAARAYLSDDAPAAE
ncbi:MAG: hypothetical protein ACXWJF_12970 [Burkholderiaceae bacterium]